MPGPSLLLQTDFDADHPHLVFKDADPAVLPRNQKFDRLEPLLHGVESLGHGGKALANLLAEFVEPAPHGERQLVDLLVNISLWH